MLNTGWQFLSQDVSLIGGFHSPLLSWLAAGGILAMCVWHSLSLLRTVFRIRQTFRRIETPLVHLVGARRETMKDWMVIPALARKQPAVARDSDSRRDLDDLQALDRMMRAERALAHEWLSYRKTLAVEQPSWFIEPTVYAGRSAAEFFSFDSLWMHHLNVRFYQQLPSILTGIGLMFTFVAILIGLSKLRANGLQIEGIQGLINGLAGKFVTSIVGLACANAFTLVEKSVWYRLARQHQQIVSLLDQIFPQKVLDRGAGQRPPSASGTIDMAAGMRMDSAHQLVEAVHQRLGAAASALTTVAQSLSASGPGDARNREAALASDIGHAVRQSLRPLLDPLQRALRDLNDSMNKPPDPSHLSPLDVEKMIDRLRARLDGAPVTTTGGARHTPTHRAGGLPRLRGCATEEAESA